MNFLKVISIFFVLLGTANSVIFKSYGDVLHINFVIRCFKEPGKQKIKKARNIEFNALASLSSNESWIFTSQTKFKLLPSGKTYPPKVNEEITGINDCYLETWMEQAEAVTPKVFEMTTSLPYAVKVSFRNNTMYPHIIYREEDPIFCTYFGEVMSYDILYDGDIADIEPMPFNAVIGFGNVKDNYLFMSSHKQILAVYVHQLEQEATIGYDENLREAGPLSQLTEYVEMPVISGQYRRHWGIKLQTVEFYWPRRSYLHGVLKEPFIAIKDPDSPTGSSYDLVLETGNEYISVPKDIMKKLYTDLKCDRFNRAIDYNKCKLAFYKKKIESLRQFLSVPGTEMLYEDAVDLMPYLIFNFSGTPQTQVKIPSYLLVEAYTRTYTYCKSLVFASKKEDNLWRAGIPFFRRAYVEFLYRDNAEKSVIKIYPKKHI